MRMDSSIVGDGDVVGGDDLANLPVLEITSLRCACGSRFLVDGSRVNAMAMIDAHKSCWSNWSSRSEDDEPLSYSIRNVNELRSFDEYKC